MTLPEAIDKTKPKVAVIAVVTFGLLRLGCGIDKSNLPEDCTIEMKADSDTVEISSSLKFELISRCNSFPVYWSVDDTLGGTPSIGMITQQGLYIAPAKVPGSGKVTVCAKAVYHTIVRCRDIAIVDAPQSIRLVPATRKVAMEDSLKFTANATGCQPDSFIWSLEKIVGDNFGRITAEGTYYAPSTLKGSVEVMVMAKAKGCSGKTGLARIMIIPRMFWVEAEAFIDSSGTDIKRGVSCGAGEGVTGLDSTGEWIEIPIDVPATGVYQPSIFYASAYKDTLELEMTTYGCGEDTLAIGFVLKDGTGVGG